ncbi:MAG: hypothetical protein GC154_04345 [bacterium]|nr:hypothetical protein [bacterium]
MKRRRKSLLTPERRRVLLAIAAPVLVAIAVALLMRVHNASHMRQLVESGVLAVYDGGQVTDEDVRGYIAHPPTEDSPILRALELTPEDMDGLDSEAPEWLEQEFAQALLKRIIQHIVIVNVLLDENVAVPPDVEEDTNTYREGLMLERLESELDQIAPEITQQEMLSYYAKNPGEFFQEGKRLARHVMVYDESHPSYDDSPEAVTAAVISRELNEGADFHDLVQYSQSETAASDGYLGWVGKGVTSVPFEKALWALDIREITGPVQVGDTLHFIQLIDKIDEGLLPFDQCQDQIRAMLLEQKSMRHRYNLLGLSYPGDEGHEERYHAALLKAAYAKGYDKDEEIAAKTEAYHRFRVADSVFKKRVEAYKRRKGISSDEEPPWLSESVTAQNLLNRFDFKLLVKLNTPESNRPDDHPSDM